MTATCYRVVDHKHHDRTNNSDNHAVNVQARNTWCPEQIKQISAYKGTNNSEHDVEPEPLALPIDNLASDEPGDQTKDDPTDDTHLGVSS